MEIKIDKQAATAIAETCDRLLKGQPPVAGSAICYAPPRFRWEQCYELGNRVHWALCDTQTDADAPPHRVSCLEMILWDHHSPDLPNQLMPKLIVELLNAHYAKAHNVQSSGTAAEQDVKMKICRTIS